MDALAALTRLARQALDEERRALAQIDQAIDGVRALLVEACAAAARERRAADALADGHARLLAYLGRMSGQTASLQAELQRLGERREEHAARLAERHLELRRLEIRNPPVEAVGQAAAGTGRGCQFHGRRSASCRAG